VADEAPLWNLLGALRLRHDRRLQRLLLLAHAEKAGGLAGSGETLPLLRAWRHHGGRDLVQEDGPHSRKIEAAQKGSGRELAGPRQIHQELHHGPAQLAKLARELVDSRQLFAIMLARQKFRPLVAERIIKVVKRRREPLPLLFRVNA
jgi:hypothetical protein